MHESLLNMGYNWSLKSYLIYIDEIEGIKEILFQVDQLTMEDY